MNQSSSPIVDGLLDMLDSARAQTYEGRQLAIQIAKNMEKESKEREMREKALLQFNLDMERDSKEREMRDKALIQFNLDNKNMDITALTEDKRMLREHNQMLRETVAAREKEIKRLQEDLQVYRSACVSEKLLAGEGPSAAKRPRTDSPDGSGAKP